jgi:sialate O-acetylesterase
MDVPVWGWAERGEKVVVKCSWHNDAEYTVEADKDDKWMVRVKTAQAGGPYQLSICGQNTLNIKNVLVGEVWVCSGQSNMEWSVRRCADPEQEIAAADYPNIRLFQVRKTHSAAPQTDCKASWWVCSPETVTGFSAAAYYFGRELHKDLNIPIGLIQSCWGGTVAEAWTRREILIADPELRPIIDRFDAAYTQYIDAMKDYSSALVDWLIHVRQAVSQGAAIPAEPEKPGSPEGKNSPSRLYNGMIVPLIPYGMRGVIWYQGESNVPRAYQYRTLFPAMIRNWRLDWGQGDFPFYYVQLAPYNYDQEFAAAELREAQLMTLTVPNTGMIVTTDIGKVQDIHPRNKQEVGRRLALWALAKTYGREGLVYSGPIYKSMRIEGSKIRLFFDHIGGGLTAKGGPLTHFAIAGEDRQFVEAGAVIDGDTVVVSGEKVAEPVAVRFAWSNTAEPNLFNKEGLPASPFRTDNWPGVTGDKK